MNLKALVCWIVVGIPLGWGLYTSIVKTQPLFTQTVKAPAKPTDAPTK
jgi:hypothetical protein